MFLYSTTESLGIRLAMAVALLCLSLTAHAFKELDDAELDQVTAGAASVSQDEDLLNLEFLTTLNNGTSVSANGTLQVREGGTSITNRGNLVISDNAQGNLSAIVNVNAVNSPVQVLLNLNITVNSTIGGVEQINITGPNGLLLAR